MWTFFHRLFEHEQEKKEIKLKHDERFNYVLFSASIFEFHRCVREKNIDSVSIVPRTTQKKNYRKCYSLLLIRFEENLRGKKCAAHFHLLIKTLFPMCVSN